MKNIRESVASNRFYALLWLCFTCLVLYARILSHDFVTLWGDNSYATDNPAAWG